MHQGVAFIDVFRRFARVGWRRQQVGRDAVRRALVRELAHVLEVARLGLHLHREADAAGRLLARRAALPRVCAKQVRSP